MLSALIKFSLERPGVVIALVALLAAIGVWHYPKLPIDAVPDITNVQVVINTKAPGYTPLETEQRVTFPLENAMTGMAGLSYTRSASHYSLSQITVVFEDGTDIHLARQQVAERLNTAKANLPQGLEPTLGPLATGLGEIFMFTVDAAPGATHPDGTPITPTDLRATHDWIIRPQLLRVAGVVEVNPIGGDVAQVVISPRSLSLLEHGLTYADVVAAVEAHNQNRGASFIEHNGTQWLLRVPGQPNSLDDIAATPLRGGEGTLLRLADVASIRWGTELRQGAATQNGREVVMSTVFMLAGANSRVVAQQVAAKLQEASRSLPPGITANPVYDRTKLVNQTLKTVQTNLVEGALLVIAILFLFLGNLRAALLTALVIPIAMLMTITGMVQTRVSANLMSLGALDFGLLVDGGVIIVENCMRRLSEQGSAPLPLKERLNVTYRATNEVIRPALFGVFIITIVYLPIFALTGVEGKMFHPMATTVVIALLSALVLALTFVPAGVALLFKGPVHEKANPVVSLAERAYRPLLRGVLTYRYGVLAGALSFVAACAWLGSKMGSEFVPNLDEGDIAMHALRIPGTSLPQAIALQAELEKRISALPEVERVFTKMGTAEVATDAVPPSVADNFVILKPREEWPDPKASKESIVNRIAALVEPIPGNRYEFLQPIQMRFNELIAGVRSELAVKIFGDDLTVLAQLGQEIQGVIEATEGSADVGMEQITGLPVLTFQPNMDALARYGLTLGEVQQAVAAAVGGAPAGQLYQGDRRIDIVVRLPDDQRSDLTTLTNLTLPIADGSYVLLQELVDVEQTQGVNQVNRENGKRRLIVTSNVRGTDLGSFVTKVQDNIAMQVSIPPGYWIEYGGTFQNLISAQKTLSLVVPFTLALILGLLILALRSTTDALIIFTGVPLALTGGILALVLRDIPFSISAAVGFIALSGVAVLNGLVLVSFIRDLQARGIALELAITQGAMERLRPVLITALVASLGFVPMAFNTGIGSEVQRPLATVVVGGILSSTLLTLLVLPALYRVVHYRQA
jgi:cobalt-zinc-cadmium resistance protein CzcA